MRKFTYDQMQGPKVDYTAHWYACRLKSLRRKEEGKPTIKTNPE